VLDGDSSLEESLARRRERKQAFLVFLGHLRDVEPPFAEVSVLHPVERGDWQAAVYLLSGCCPVWRVFRAPVIRARSIAPVAVALARGNPGGCGTERAVMSWAAHFWDLRRHHARYPFEFSDFYFRRWMTALHLRHQMPPGSR
jgi:hypothetical protein